MTRSQALLEEVESLPIDERLMLVDQLLRSLHGTGSGNDRKWLAEANKRLRDVKAGRVETIPGREVLAEARRRLSQGMTSIQRQKPNTSPPLPTMTTKTSVSGRRLRKKLKMPSS